MGKEHQDCSLSAEIRSWVDNCLVPILASAFLKESKKILATESALVSESSEAAVRCEVNQ
jgi:hypothetical protein